MAIKKVYFVRHGQTDANVDRYIGGPDEVLNTVGEEQARVVGNRLQSLTIDVVLHSNWERARQTAEFLNQKTNVELLALEELGEYKFPESCTNLNYTDEKVVAFAEAWKDNLTDPDFRYDEAETFNDLLKRSQVLKNKLEKMEFDTMVAVTHSRFLRFFTSFMLVGEKFTPEIDYHMAHIFKPSNTGITLFEYDGAEWKLKTWNDIAHFAE